MTWSCLKDKMLTEILLSRCTAARHDTIPTFLHLVWKTTNARGCFCPPHPPWPLFSTKVRKREAKTQSLWHRRRPEGSVPHSSDYTICHVPNLEAIRHCVWFECTGGGREPSGRARAVSEVHMEGGTSAEGVVHHVNTLSWAPAI